MLTQNILHVFGIHSVIEHDLSSGGYSPQWKYLFCNLHRSLRFTPSHVRLILFQVVPSATVQLKRCFPLMLSPAHFDRAQPIITRDGAVGNYVRMCERVCVCVCVRHEQERVARWEKLTPTNGNLVRVVCVWELSCVCQFHHLNLWVHNRMKCIP